MAGGQELLPLVDMLRRSGIESTIECLGGNVWGVKAHTRAGLEVLVTESQETECRVDVGLYSPDGDDEPLDMACDVWPSMAAKTMREWGA